MHRTEWAVVMALPRPVPCLGAWQRQRLGRTGRVVTARGGGSKAQRPRLLLLRLPRPPLPTSASPRTPSGDRAELGAGAATATPTRMGGVETAEAAQADIDSDQTVVSQHLSMYCALVSSNHQQAARTCRQS